MSFGSNTKLNQPSDTEISFRHSEIIPTPFATPFQTTPFSVSM
jgi:hypothetical protein